MSDSMAAAGGRLTADDLNALNEEIAAMARAGLPLDQGLTLLAKEIRGGRFRAVTASLAADLQSGKTLSEAMAAQGDRVPPYYGALIAAGVRSGRLGDVLATLTVYARSMAELRASVIQAILYPVILLGLGVVLVTFWLLYLAPPMRQMIADFRLRVPAVTQFVYGIIDHPYSRFVIPLIVLLGVPIATWIVLSRFEKGRQRLARLLYAIPLLGSLIRSARLSGFVDLLGILTENQVPLPEAFHLATAASSDPLLREAGPRVVRRLEAGSTLANALTGETMLPQFFVWTAATGERNQRLPESLRSLAGVYRKRCESRAVLFGNVFPSIVLVLVATILVGFVAAVMLVPMLSLLEGLSGGGL